MSTSHFSAKAFSKMADDDLSSELSVNVKVSFDPLTVTVVFKSSMKSYF